jgi:transposase-like protein
MAALDARKLRAAVLVVDGELTRAEIAGEIGITERQLYNWMNEPEFMAAVDEALSKLRREVLPMAFQRLKRVIANGADKDAVSAIQLAFKQAGWLDRATPIGKTEDPDDEQRTGVVFLPVRAPAWAELGG